MQKSPKKYWFKRQQDQHNKSKSNINSMYVSKVSKTVEQPNDKQHDNNIAILQRKYKKVNHVAISIGKLQDFYQILCSGENVNAASVRCYIHNNQLILYCQDQQKLLCPNCMFSSGQGQHPKHTNHDVRQTQKSSVQIQNNVKIWQYELQQQISQIQSCEQQWQKLRKTLQQMKTKIMKQLDKEYDNIQMQLSKLYIEVKNSIEEAAKKYEEPINKTIQGFRFIRKLMIPNRYPMVLVKHVWLEYVRNVVQQLPLNAKEVDVRWVKSCQNLLKIFVKKFAIKQ